MKNQLVATLVMVIFSQVGFTQKTITKFGIGYIISNGEVSAYSANQNNPYLFRSVDWYPEYDVAYVQKYYEGRHGGKVYKDYNFYRPGVGFLIDAWFDPEKVTPFISDGALWKPDKTASVALSAYKIEKGKPLQYLMHEHDLYDKVVKSYEGRKLPKFMNEKKHDEKLTKQGFEIGEFYNGKAPIIGQIHKNYIWQPVYIFGTVDNTLQNFETLDKPVFTRQGNLNVVDGFNKYGVVDYTYTDKKGKREYVYLDQNLDEIKVENVGGTMKPKKSSFHYEEWEDGNVTNEFLNGKVVTKSNGIWVEMDKSGKVLFTFPQEVIRAGNFRFNRAIVRLADGFNLIDRNGKYLIETTNDFEIAEKYKEDFFPEFYFNSEGKIPAKSGQSYFLVDTLFNVIAFTSSEDKYPINDELFVSALNVKETINLVDYTKTIPGLTFAQKEPYYENYDKNVEVYRGFIPNMDGYVQKGSTEKWWVKNNTNERVKVKIEYILRFDGEFLSGKKYITFYCEALPNDIGFLNPRNRVIPKFGAESSSAEVRVTLEK